jgi:hypothetical protein
MVEGATIVNVTGMVQPEPVAVTVSVPATSGAVYEIELPDVAESVPEPDLLHVALPSEKVHLTSSPTPMVVRARLAGWVATVSVVMVHVTHDVDVPPPLAGAEDGFVGVDVPLVTGAPEDDGGVMP